MGTTGGYETPRLRTRLMVLGSLATTLVAGGWFLPLWRATLHAPQYPGGLTMHAYGHQVTGDIGEISNLNHYVGMRPFDLVDFPELALWPYAIGVAVVAVVAGLIARHRIVRLFAVTYLWGLPIGVLAVIQLRLYQYGQNLDPGAALRIDPFTPLVVGPTKVWNFVTWSWPGIGLVSLILAAAVVTFGPRTTERFCARFLTVGSGLLLILVVAALPASAHDHGDHAPRPTDTSRTRLQQLLNDASEGQRIVLPPGEHAGPITIDVPVVLDGRSAATIVGDGTGTVVTVNAPGTVIRGLGIRGSGPGPTGNPAGVLVAAEGVTVEQLSIEDTYIGIAVDEADRVRIVGNTIRGRVGAAIIDESHAVDHDDEGDHAQAHGSGHDGRGDGIRLHDANHVLIRGNDLAHTRDGIYVSFGSDSIIDGNVIREGRYAVHTMYTRDLTVIENHLVDNLSGAVLMYRGPVLALRNVIERNDSPSTGFGMLLKDVVGADVIENVLIDNRTGVHVDGPTGTDERTRFTSNTIARNITGIAAYPSARATFRGNSFVDNHVQVLGRGGRLREIEWFDRGLGNFWSTYRGYEGFATGFGAVAHEEGGSVDRLLGRNPELLAIADAPALRLLRSIEERWGRQDPVAIDQIPLTAPISPAVAPSGDPPIEGAGAVAGLLLMSPALLAFTRRRPSTNASRRLSDGIAA